MRHRLAIAIVYPLACALHAVRSDDHARLDEACSLGVADACSWLSSRLEDTDPDAEAARDYLTAACQLGLPMACQELGRRLSPGCRPEPARPCYEPDPVQAATALEIGCAAGWCAASR